MSRRRPVSNVVAIVATAAFPFVAIASNCPSGDQALQQSTSLDSLCPNGFTANVHRTSMRQAMQDNSANVQMISAAAQQQGVPVWLALGVAYQESGFMSCAGSDTGVKGPMQLTRATGRGLGFDREVNEQNILGGMALLRQAVNACGSDDYACLAARYNGSPRAGEQAGWARGVGNYAEQVRADQSLQDQACPGNSTAGTQTPPDNRGAIECPQPDGAGATPSRSAADFQKYLGQSWGDNQECASLTKYFDPSLGPASTWRRGDPVQGNTALKPGTPIATFNFGDRYGPSDSPGGRSGVSHTGVYLGQDASGVKILDQWNGSGGARIHTIAWDAWNGNAAEGGSRYYTITH